MKKLAFGILISFLLAFTACLDDDGYSLGDIWISFGIYQESDEGSRFLILDNGDVLVPVAATNPGWYNDFEDGDRVLVNYTILDEDLTSSSSPRYFVKINGIDDVLMKGILDITEENADSIGNDPIIVENVWMTDSLLNFKLKYWGYNKIHYLNLVKQPGELKPEDQPIQLELRHNANDDQESIPYTAYVSFSLNNIRINGLDSVKFEFVSTDYEGVEHTDNGTFNYKGLE